MLAATALKIASSVLVADITTVSILVNNFGYKVEDHPDAAILLSFLLMASAGATFAFSLFL